MLYSLQPFIISVCQVRLKVGYGYNLYPHKSQAGNVTPKVVKTKCLKKLPLKVGLWGVDRTFGCYSGAVS